MNERNQNNEIAELPGNDNPQEPLYYGEMDHIASG